MTPQDHIKLNKAKCLLICQFVKFEVIELLTQLKIVSKTILGFESFLCQKNSGQDKMGLKEFLVFKILVQNESWFQKIIWLTKKGSVYLEADHGL